MTNEQIEKHYGLVADLKNGVGKCGETIIEGGEQ